MATAAHTVEVPIDAYLSTSYRPDREWIEGELKERHGGERPHAGMQRIFLKFFFAVEDRLGVLAYPELRVQVAEARFRVPDVLVLRKSDPYDHIVTVPPILCVEILSPEDRMSDMHNGRTITCVWESPKSGSWIRSAGRRGRQTSEGSIRWIHCVCRRAISRYR